MLTGLRGYRCSGAPDTLRYSQGLSHWENNPGGTGEGRRGGGDGTSVLTGGLAVAMTDRYEVRHVGMESLKLGGWAGVCLCRSTISY